MKDLAKIQAAYDRCDELLEQCRASSKGASLARLDEIQTLNDQAYFLLCWGQLESEINGRCRSAIRLRRDDPDWQTRRGWDLYNPDDARLSGLSFEDRVKLVLDQREGRGKPFAKTLSYYAVRNRIAHGKLESSRVEVSAFVEDCFEIQAALHRAG